MSGGMSIPYWDSLDETTNQTKSDANVNNIYIQILTISIFVFYRSSVLVVSSNNVIQKYVCKKCGHSTETESGMRRHRLTKHEVGKNNVIEKYVCKECGHSTDTKSGMRRHRLTKHEVEKKTFKCSKCTESFCEYRQLKQHDMQKHGGIKYSCHQCQQTFVHKTNLQRHIRAHQGGEKELMCEICGSCFMREDNLKAHRQSKHSDIKMYKCDVCSASYKWQIGLLRHKRTAHKKCTSSQLNQAKD